MHEPVKLSLTDDDQDRRDQRILQILFQLGIPTTEAEVMKACRAAYGDGYLLGQERRPASATSVRPQTDATENTRGAGK